MMTFCEPAIFLHRPLCDHRDPSDWNLLRCWKSTSNSFTIRTICSHREVIMSGGSTIGQGLAVTSAGRAERATRSLTGNSLLVTDSVVAGDGGALDWCSYLAVVPDYGVARGPGPD